MNKTALRFGLLVGLLFVLIFGLTHALTPKGPEGFAIQELIGYAGILLALCAIFFAVKTHRDNHLGGKISFGRAFGLGMMISAISGLILGIFTIILLVYVYPDFGTDYMNYMMQSLETSGGTPEMINAQKAEMAAYSSLINNVPFQGAIMMMTVVFIGLLHSLIAALIFKRK